MEKHLPVVDSPARRPSRKELEEAITGARVTTPPLGKDGEPPSLQATVAEMHGIDGSVEWAAPVMTKCADVDARPGYNSRKAHEYEDTPEVFERKIQMLADMVRRSKALCAYTGAGISTASGIDDYATKGGAQAGRKVRSPVDAEPTLAHRVLTAMHAQGHLKHWIQQNHDGLPQKAGFPQHALNEIHGAWFDPSNPVVKMNGDLRSDLFSWLMEWETKADLVIAMGTSLAGMNADRVVDSVAERARLGMPKKPRRKPEGNDDAAIGAVIVSIQQTSMDDRACLRIFAKIDRVADALARELAVDVPPAHDPDVDVDVDSEEASVRWSNVAMVPYGPDGVRLEGGELRKLDLSEDARVRITMGPFAGDEGEVVGHTKQGHWKIRFMHTIKGTWKAPMEHRLGRWWLDEAINGQLPMCPVVSIEEADVA